MKKFSILLWIGLVFLYSIENINIFIILFTGISIYVVHKFITNIIDIKTFKNKVSSKIDLYCKEPIIGIFIFFFWVFFIIIANRGLDFKYIIENFYKVPFKEQHLFIFTINGSIWMLCFFIMSIYAKISSKKGILYKEGFLLGDGKLYRFDSVKSYDFNISFKGIKYNNLVLNFDNKVTKTLHIYKDDIEKFKDLLEKYKNNQYMNI